MISFSGSSRPIGSLKKVKLSIVNSFVLTEKKKQIILLHHLNSISTNT